MFPTVSVPVCFLYRILFSSTGGSTLTNSFHRKAGDRERTGFANMYAMRKKMMCLGKGTAVAEFRTTLTVLGLHNYFILALAFAHIKIKL